MQQQGQKNLYTFREFAKEKGIPLNFLETAWKSGNLTALMSGSRRYLTNDTMIEIEAMGRKKPTAAATEEAAVD